MQSAGNRMKRSRRAITSMLLSIAFVTVAALPGNAASPTVDATITAIPDAQWNAMIAAGVWHKGCPVDRSQLSRVDLNFNGFDGNVHRGALIVRTDVAASVVRIFTRLFDSGFRIRRMSPIEAYHGDDNASMAADNTSAFNCRRASQANAPVTGSPHANGRAIDVNPYENPWIDPRCNCFRPDSKYGKQRTGQGVITKGSVAWQAFTNEGWIWQDNKTPDYQHFDTGYPSHPLPTTASIFPVPVAVGDATQIITIKAVGSSAKFTAWTKASTGWRTVISTTAARIGSMGVTDGNTRRQNTNTTPSGTYAITQAFGILPNPGTTLPYHLVTKDDWWVEDNNSPYYNSLRTSSQGGFDMAAPESSVNGSEHLVVHPGQYDYAIVVDYNMAPSVPYRGAGIFIHVSTGHPTAGCIAVPKSTIIALLRWLDPAAHPRIAIG